MSSKTKNVPLSEATMPQLVQFATTALGLEVKASHKKADVIGLIQTAWDNDYIIAKDESEQAAPAAEPVVGAVAPTPQSQSKLQSELNVVAQNSQNDRRCRIIVAEGRGKEGKRPVPVAVNGVQILIPRGKPVVVAERYMEALDHAVRTEYEQDGADNMIESQVHAYPFQFMGYVDAEGRATA